MAPDYGVHLSSDLSLAFLLVLERLAPGERAAFTEAVTLVADTHVPDDAHAAVREQFSEDELIALTWAIAAINVWNRLGVSFRLPVEGYQSADR